MGKSDIVVIGVDKGNSTSHAMYFELFSANSKCPSMERRFSHIVEPGNDYYRKGTLIYNNGELVGLTKFFDQKGMILFHIDSNGELPVLDLPDDVTNVLHRFSDYKFVSLKTFFKRDLSDDWLRLNVDGTLPLGNIKERYFGQTTDKYFTPEHDSLFRIYMKDVYSENAGRKHDYGMKADYGELLDPLIGKREIFSVS